MRQYLMYDEEGTFLGVVNEHVEHNILFDNSYYHFFEIPYMDFSEKFGWFLREVSEG